MLLGWVSAPLSVVATAIQVHMKNFQTISEYIAASPEGVRATLRKIRAAIKNVAPDAEEAIRYGMPTFRLHGNLVHFAAFKSHIGFFPAPSAVRAFAKELSKYETSKGTVRFPLDVAIPLAVIQKIVRFRVKEQMKRRAYALR